MSTYGTMQARIAGELNRTDLTNEIKDAIQSAITFYAPQRFAFNEGRASLVTVASQEYYGVPTDFLELDRLGVTVNARYYQLIQKTDDYLDEINWGAGTWQGFPYFFALYEQNLRLYPIPNASYTLTMAYLKSLSAVSATADTNAWMVQGEELIRLHAKVDLLENVIRGSEAQREAKLLRQREGEVFRHLFINQSKQRATGRLRPSLW